MKEMCLKPAVSQWLMMGYTFSQWNRRIGNDGPNSWRENDRTVVPWGHSS